VTPGVGYVYTNTTAATNAAGVYSLPVNVADSGTPAGTASNNIALTVTEYLTWNGDGSGNSFWDTTGDVEWQNARVYSNAYTVRFDDSATGVDATNVNLLETLLPGGIVVSNTAGTPTANYTFNGSTSTEAISGTTSLLKQGSGALTLQEGSDNFSGGITVGGGSLLISDNPGTVAILGGLTVTNGGSVILDEVGSISGGITIGNASSVQIGENDQYGHTFNGIVTMDGTLIFNNSIDVPIANVISGASTGNLVQSNVNNVTLSGASTFAGNVLVNSGTLTDTKVGAADGSNGGLGIAAAGKTVTVNSGAALVVAQNVFGGNLVSEANMPSLIINGGTVNDTTKYTSIGSVTLNNGATLTQSPSSVNSYQGYQFRGSITVGGSSPSTISTGNGADNHLDTNTVFNVADVTGDSGADLTVSTGLRNTSPDFGQVPSSLIKSGTGTMLLTASNTYTGNTIISAGTLALSGSISNSPNIIVSSGATFDISALSPAFVLMPNQTLSNNTSTAILNGSADASAGKISLTYASGTPSFNIPSGTLTLASGTTFKVNNTGAALAAGSYKIISKAGSGSVGGTAPSSVTVSGGGIVAGGTASLSISNNELYLVVSGASSPFKFTGISINGTTLTLSGTNGPDNGNYVLLESTNVALPLTNWIPVLTNTFDGSGNLNLSTNIVNPNNSQQFYILSQ